MSLFSGRVYIYNYETAQIIKSLEIVQSPIRTCKFIERKSWFVIGCDDSHIRVYNYNTLEKVCRFIPLLYSNRSPNLKLTLITFVVSMPIPLFPTCSAAAMI